MPHRYRAGKTSPVYCVLAWLWLVLAGALAGISMYHARHGRDGLAEVASAFSVLMVIVAGIFTWLMRESRR